MKRKHFFLDKQKRIYLALLKRHKSKKDAVSYGSCMVLLTIIYLSYFVPVATSTSSSGAAPHTSFSSNLTERLPEHILLWPNYPCPRRAIAGSKNTFIHLASFLFELSHRFSLLKYAAYYSLRTRVLVSTFKHFNTYHNRLARI